MGTLSLAIAAYYQIYHTAHKEEANRPRLIIFPEFGGDKPLIQIGFVVYNVGKTVAKNCKVYLKIIQSGDNKTLTKTYWTWVKYNIRIKISEGFNIKFRNLENIESIDIYPHEKASLSYIPLNILLGKKIDTAQKVPETYLIIDIKIFSENMTTPGMYVLGINWTGDYLDTDTEQINIEYEKRKALEERLHDEMLREYRSTSWKYFLRKRRF